MAAELSDGASELAGAVVREIRDRFPELFVTDEDFDENRAATEANLRQFADSVATGRDPRDIELPAVAVAYVREGVHRGVPASAFVRSLRLGHAASWRTVLGQLELRAADKAQLRIATELASAWLFAYVDALSTYAEDVYTSERDRWVRSTAALQTETIQAILAERGVDVALAARRLRYELDRDHLAVVGWSENVTEGHDPMAELEVAVAGLARSLGVGPPLIEPLGPRVVAGWFGSRSRFESATIDALRVEPGVARVARVAIGEPGSGIVGFRQSHRQAQHARRVAMLTGVSAGTSTRYRRVALRAMATVDPDQARALRSRRTRQPRGVRRSVGTVGGDAARLLRGGREPPQRGAAARHPREHRSLPCPSGGGSARAECRRTHARLARGARGFLRDVVDIEPITDV